MSKLLKKCEGIISQNKIILVKITLLYDEIIFSVIKVA